MKALIYDPKEIGLTIGKSMGCEVFVNCPFHGDTHPSAEFNVQTGRFFCFACGARSYAPFLARKLGGTCSQEFRELPEKDADVDDAWIGMKNAPLGFNNEYLLSRNVTNIQIKKYDIRETSWGVLFPLRNENGIIKGMLARKYKGEQKYLVFGEKMPLYALDQFQFYYGEVIVTEGVFGVLAADRANLPATATLSAMVKESASVWLNQVDPIVCYDDDDSGYIGAAKVLKLAPMARAIVYGGEFDNLTPQEFYDVVTHPELTAREYTRSIEYISEYTSDKKKFWNDIENFGKYMKKKNFTKGINLTNEWMRG